MQRRTLTDTLAGQFRDGPQMALVAGPRQVGKTTACLSFAGADATGSSHAGVRYFNGDDEEARRTILAGSSAVAEAARLATLAERPPVLVFDELHKYPRWKSFLKGFHDVHRSRCRVIVTGSSRLDVHRRGGDSPTGRYFLHRLHPLSAGEIPDPSPRDDPVSPPRRVRDADWSALTDPGARAETFVACHLLKAVDVWTDAGLGTFELRYLRDKEKREVDFAVIRDGSPWFLVEVKRADERLSPSLAHFQRAIGARHAFQVVLDAPFVAADAFSRTEPCVVPARTLLSQIP